MAIAIKSANKFIFSTITSSSSSSNNNKIDELIIRERRNKPPTIISTNPNHIKIDTLSNLYLACNHSPHRFPSPAGKIDAGKLAVAVSHSSVVVSVFSAVSGGDVKEREEEKGLWGRILPSAMAVTPENGELVGFGRAVSDMSLTASIYDVMVIPSLRGFGIGRMIVQRITRVLLSKGIYDISALCSEKERLFFAACGFGDDFLGSTTMMYAKTTSSNSNNNELIIQAGRKLLVAPPPRLPFRPQKQPLNIAQK